jgi:lauroyl/myristoyl acyltransferase
MSSTVLTAQSKVFVDHFGNDASMPRGAYLIATPDAWVIAPKMVVAEQE